MVDRGWREEIEEGVEWGEVWCRCGGCGGCGERWAVGAECACTSSDGVVIGVVLGDDFEGVDVRAVLAEVALSGVRGDEEVADPVLGKFCG
jgi:hypothetical protein